MLLSAFNSDVVWPQAPKLTHAKHRRLNQRNLSVRPDLAGKTPNTNQKSNPGTMKNSNLFNYVAARFKQATFALMLVSVGAFKAQAVDEISFNISSPKYPNLMTAGDYAGAPGARTNNWNNLLASADGSAANITLADGSVSNSAGNIVNGMSVVFHPTSSGGGIFNRGSGSFTNDSKMYIDVDDAYGCSGFSQYGYIDITNIPYANYNIYCYFRPDNGSGSANTRGGFWVITNTPVGSQRYYIQNQSNDVAQTQEPVPSSNGGGYVQSTTTSIPAGGAPWSSIHGGNYAVFSNLTNSWTRVWFGGLGNGSGAVDDLGNYVNGGALAVRFKVAGFQVVQVPTGVATSLYLQNTNLTLHAGNPSGTQLTVLADLDTGATGVNVTTASGIAYSVTDPAVATVGATGLLTPGTNGTANLIVSYEGISLTNAITVIGPTSLSISVAKTNLLYGNSQGDTTTATLYANFSDANNVVVNNYKFVSFSGTGGVITATTNGILTAVGVGAFGVTGIYDGVSVTANNVGVVTAFSAPGGVATLSVDITDSSTHGMTFHDFSGAPGARSAYWNDLVVPSSGNVTNQIVAPLDNQGNMQAGTLVQWIPNSPGSSIAYTQGTLTTNESVMFGAFFDQGMNNGTSYNSQLVVSNVPFSTYDAYFYFYNDNSSNGTNRPGQVTINGVTQYRINSMSYPTMPDNNGNGYVQAISTGLPGSVTAVPFGNYVKFSGLSNNVLNVSWGAVGQDYIADASSVTRARLAGFQIVKSLDGLTATNIYLQSPVPAQLPGNPATYALTVLADFSDGTMGGNITALSGVGFSSSDNNVFQVDANGVITPGLTPGTANLTVTYQSNTLVVSVTNLAPTSVKVTAKPGTVYLDGSLGLIIAQASAFANFPGNTNVNISGFNSISFVDQGSPVCSLAANGVITPNAVQGSANLGVSYLGATYVSTNAFTVTSIANAPVLKHLYNFTNTTQVIDSIGGANGTVYPPLGANRPIVLDGARVIFPGDGTYANAPYIALPSGMINQMGDVSIEMWCGRDQLNAWARFWSFGSTTKGTDPHNSGSFTSGIQMIDSYSATGTPDFSGPGWGDWRNTFNFTNGAEYQVVTIIAPNAGTAAFYINGVLVTNGTPTLVPLSTSVNDTVDWLGVSLYNDSPLAGWINQIAIYEGVLSPTQIAADYAAGQSVFLPPSTVATNIVPMTFSVSSGTLNLAWPSDHLGWTLEVQTNSLSAGLGTNWIPVSNSTTVTNLSIPINTLNGSVFYRLMYQP